MKSIEAVDTLAVIEDAQQTVFVDSSLAQHTLYLYRVSVTNTSGFEVETPEWEAVPLQLPAVRIVDVEFSSATATAQIAWTPYAGPNFIAYRVERHTAGRVPQVVWKTEEQTTISLVDSGLVANTEHFYRVVVETERGEEVVSEEVSGTIHPFVKEWPQERASTCDYTGRKTC